MPQSVKQQDVPAMEQQTEGIPLTIDPASARTLGLTLGFVVFLIGAYAAALIWRVPDQLFRLPGILIALVVAIATYAPLRRGDGRAAINVLSHGTFIYIAAAAVTGGGLQASILIALPLVIVIPGLLLGRNLAKRFTLLSVVLCVVLFLGFKVGLIPNQKLLPPEFIAVLLLVVIGVACVMTYFAAGVHAQRLHKVQHLNSELMTAQQEFRTLADNLPALVMRSDLNLICTYVNQPLLEFARLSALDLIGQPLKAIFTANQFSMVPAAVQAALDGERVTFLAPHQRGEEQRIFELVMVSETDLQDQPIGLLAVFYDVTDRERLSVELRRAATHDFLTGIANRLQVDDQLQSALERARRHKKYAALLVIDLDGFKPVNDVYGHAAGDHLLKHVATQLKNSVRLMDTVGRIGGDEFVAVIEGLDQVGYALTVAEKLLAAVRQPVAYEEHTLSVGASIGIAVFPLHGESVHELFLAADTAMYAAKGAGKNCCRLVTV